MSRFGDWKPQVTRDKDLHIYKIFWDQISFRTANERKWGVSSFILLVTLCSSQPRLEFSSPASSGKPRTPSLRLFTNSLCPSSCAPERLEVKTKRKHMKKKGVYSLHPPSHNRSGVQVHVVAARHLTVSVLLNENMEVTVVWKEKVWKLKKKPLKFLATNGWNNVQWLPFPNSPAVSSVSADQTLVKSVNILDFKWQ